MLTKRKHRMAKNAAPKCPLTPDLSRAGFLRLAGGVGAALFGYKFAGAQTRDEGTAMHTRPIPSSGEALPVIGCGTYVGFDVGADSEKLKALADVVRSAAGCRRQGVRQLADVWSRRDRRRPAGGGAGPARTFIATKVWTRGRQAGIAQMERSFALLGSSVSTSCRCTISRRGHALATLRRWKQDGRIRYLGVTHYTSSAYDELEAVMRKEKLDFVQLNYSLDDRAAERSCCRWRQSAA